jgi:hypothetical protein
MGFINKQDTDGSKTTLLKGELGLDLTVGADTYGAVYVGDGTENIRVGGKVTTTPVITIVTTVNENATISGSYTSADGSTTTLSANLGTISNHNTVSKTFDYTAPDVTDGDDDTDTLSAYSVKIGELQSGTGTEDITVSYVPVVGDDSYVDNLAVDDSEYNEGWNIV